MPRALLVGSEVLLGVFGVVLAVAGGWQLASGRNLPGVMGRPRQGYGEFLIEQPRSFWRLTGSGLLLLGAGIGAAVLAVQGVMPRLFAFILVIGGLAVTIVQRRRYPLPSLLEAERRTRRRLLVRGIAAAALLGFAAAMLLTRRG